MARTSGNRRRRPGRRLTWKHQRRRAAGMVAAVMHSMRSGWPLLVAACATAAAGTALSGLTSCRGGGGEEGRLQGGVTPTHPHACGARADMATGTARCSAPHPTHRCCCLHQLLQVPQLQVGTPNRTEG
jgi:hypothetical protein